MSTRTFALAALVVLTAFTRLIPHPVNLAPITAMAVFGGIVTRSKLGAILMPLVALLLSDLSLEIFYRLGLARDWGFYPDMWATYGATALVALLATRVKGTRSPLTIGCMTFAGSCLHFVVTNFAYWLSYYPYTLATLWKCYVDALPFFPRTLAGDFIYATVLFGAWALAELYVPSLRSDHNPEPAPAAANS